MNQNKADQIASEFDQLLGHPGSTALETKADGWIILHDDGAFLFAYSVGSVAGFVEAANLLSGIAGEHYANFCDSTDPLDDPDLAQELWTSREEMICKGDGLCSPVLETDADAYLKSALATPVFKSVTEWFDRCINPFNVTAAIVDEDFDDLVEELAKTTYRESDAKHITRETYDEVIRIALGAYVEELGAE